MSEPFCLCWFCDYCIFFFLFYDYNCVLQTCSTVFQRYFIPPDLVKKLSLLS